MNQSNEIFNKLVLTGGLRLVGKDPETGENMYVKTEMLLNPNKWSDNK